MKQLAGAITVALMSGAIGAASAGAAGVGDQPSHGSARVQKIHQHQGIGGPGKSRPHAHGKSRSA